MKKLVSVLLSLVMAVAAFAAFAAPAMAKDAILSPTATTAQNKKPTLEVNGSTTSTDITYTVDPTNPNTVTFTYNGDGTLIGWENNLADELGFIEGTDYVAIFNEDGTYTITFISDEAIKAWENGAVSVNAIVEFDEEDTTKVPGEKPNKSPETGASTSAVAVVAAVAGAGIVALAASKKRDAE